MVTLLVSLECYPILPLSCVYDLVVSTLGLTSSFPSDGSNSSLTTPYGTTTFTKTGNQEEGTASAGVIATDPLGGMEKIEWDLAVAPNIADIATGPPYWSASPSVVPAGFTNENLIYRDSFYWSKKAMMDGPGDYNKAFIYHWLHDAATNNANVGYVIESTKAPLENRVWRAYPGQTGATYYEGTINSPSKIARILDDGTEQDFITAYNSLANITQTTDPKGRTTTYTYAPNQIDVTQISVKNGNSQDIIGSFSYNSQHLPLTATDASGQTVTYTYNAFGEVTSVTDAKGEITTCNYDSNGYLINITGPTPSSITTFSYNNVGDVQSVTDSSGYTLNYTYDAADRITRILYPDGTFSQVIYNKLDPEWARDRQGRWTLTQFDALRHLVLSEDPSGRKTLLEHCLCGALIGITDPNGNKTRYLRDLEERVLQKTAADGATWKLEYENTTSRLKSSSDPNGQVKTFTYNLDDSVASLMYTNTINPTSNVVYAYDPSYLRLSSFTDSLGTTTYNYNPVGPTPSLGANRLASVSSPLPGSTVGFSYDELGRLVGEAVPNSSDNRTFTYDALGRVGTASNALGNFTYQYVAQTRQLQSWTYPNGQTTTYSYYLNASSDGTGNGDRRLKSIKNLNPSGGTISAFAYSYDPVGEILTWNKQWDSGPSFPSAFSYDAAGQLQMAVVPNPNTFAGQSFFYSFDASGNRTQVQVEGAINTIMFGATNEAISEIGGGNMTFAGTVSEPANVTVGGQSAVVDSSNDWMGSASVSVGANSIPITATDSMGNTTNKTISVTVSGESNRSVMYDANGNVLNNGSGQVYTWDAENRLLSIAQSSGITGFVYDGAGRRLEETLNGAVIKQWIWIQGKPCEERDSNGNVTKMFFAQGEQIGHLPYFYTLDHLGSIREMTDSSGTTRARYDYDPFGRVTKMSGDLDADFGFTGHYYHIASGLDLTLYRAYDPNSGRWLSRDPIGVGGGLNLYGYVLNNPISEKDVLGLAGEWAFGMGGQTVGSFQGATAAYVVQNSLPTEPELKEQRRNAMIMGAVAASPVIIMAAPEVATLYETAGLITNAALTSAPIQGAVGDILVVGAVYMASPAAPEVFEDPNMENVEKVIVDGIATEENAISVEVLKDLSEISKWTAEKSQELVDKLFEPSDSSEETQPVQDSSGNNHGRPYCPVD